MVHLFISVSLLSWCFIGSYTQHLFCARTVIETKTWRYAHKNSHAHTHMHMQAGTHAHTHKKFHCHWRRAWSIKARYTISYMLLVFFRLTSSILPTWSNQSLEVVCDVQSVKTRPDQHSEVNAPSVFTGQSQHRSSQNPLFWPAEFYTMTELLLLLVCLKIIVTLPLIKKYGHLCVNVENDEEAFAKAHMK